ncbi:MAG TPA: aspartate/glutamate racemase family protein [Ramlibacter sp.]|nr:aspartate/glutamate racemase family protein [Ramlibacter sp.]
MPADIAFVHTSPVHVATFDALMEKQAPQMAVHHVVDETLLRDARSKGLDGAGLADRVHQAMHRGAESGARMVVCTCSTIGAIAEAMPLRGAFMVARIDRAMADEAVRLGPEVLVLAALESTLEPTQALIRDSAFRLKRDVRVITQAIPGAWQLFERADMDGYAACIAAAARQALPGPSVIVLAQASMAGAEQLLRDAGVPVLSSPRLGVAAAIAALEGAG